MNKGRMGVYSEELRQKKARAMQIADYYELTQC